MSSSALFLSSADQACLYITSTRLCRYSAKLLTPILTPPPGVTAAAEVEIMTRGKDEAENKKLFEKILEIIGEGVSLVFSFLVSF